MKINKLSLTGFGKFKNKEIKFKDGLNLVFGRNEAGKSTIQNFIKASLYGFPAQRTDGEGRPPEKSIYKPWDGSDYRGVAELTDDNGKVIRIERDFDTNDVSVFDGNLTDISSGFEYASRQGLLVGEKLLNMDRECFESTVFIKQGETTVSQSDRNHIFEKMVNLANTGKEDESTAASVGAISKALRLLGNPRTTGRIFNSASEELEEITGSLERAREDNRRMSDNIKRKKQLEQEMSSLEKKIEVAETKAAAAMLRENILQLETTERRYMSIKSEISTIEGEIHEAKAQMASLNTRNKTEQDVLSYLKGAALAAEKVKRIPPGNHRDRLSKLRKNRGKVMFFKAVLLFLSVLSIPAAIFITPFLFIAAGLLITALVLLLLVKRGYSINQLEEFISLSDECNDYLSKTNEFLLSSGKHSCGSFDEAEVLLNELYEEINKKAELESLVSNNESRKTGQEALAGEILGSFTSVNELAGRIDEMKESLDEIGSVTSTETDPPEVLRERYDTMRQDYAGIQRLVSEYVHGESDMAELEESLETARERMDHIDTERKALEKAKELLNSAADDLRGNIFPEVNERMGRFISRITGGRHSNLMAGLGRALNTKYNDTARTIWEFSDGTIDQMYLALRLSASEILSKEESLPVIIDEAFAYYDEERIKAAFGLLYEFAKERQIIIFTCKVSELMLVQKTGSVNVIEI